MKIKRTREFISDNKIIELYGAGWSINDIVAHYKTSVRRVRSVLHNVNIDTAKYRAASTFTKDCLLAMVASTLPVSKISDVTDVSSHLIRQVLREKNVNASSLRNPDIITCQGHLISDKKWSEFRRRYLAGKEGFFKCAEMCGFSVENCVEAFCRLTDDDVARHKENLTNVIVGQRGCGLSPTSVAKQLGVSTSIVKQLFIQ